jgi:hypothetical protein
MGQISVKTYAPKGSDLSGNQHQNLMKLAKLGSTIALA